MQYELSVVPVGAACINDHTEAILPNIITRREENKEEEEEEEEEIEEEEEDLQYMCNSQVSTTLIIRGR